MAWEKSGYLSVSDVVALLRIAGAGTAGAPPATRVLEGLCKLLAARGAGPAEAPDGPSAACRLAPHARGARGGSTRAALDDGGRRLCCFAGRAGDPPMRWEFRRGAGELPFGTRELAIVAATARAGLLRADEPARDGLDGFDALDPFGKLRAGGFDGFDRLTAGKPAAGKPAAGTVGTCLPRVLASLPIRQFQVLDRIWHGASEKQVAKSLRLDINTVKFHVKGLYRRFGASTRGELIARLSFGVKDAIRPADWV